MIESRERFVKAFLTEMPGRTGPKDYSIDIVNDITDVKNSEAYPVIDLGNNLKKIEGSKIVYYWFEKNNKILLGAQFEKEDYALKVNYIGKTVTGPPYASELYSAVLQNRINSGNINNIVMSDKDLNDEGFNIWKCLLISHNVSVYNRNAPNNLIPVKSLADLQNYYGNDQSFRDYRYIISESMADYAETSAIFRLRKLREDAGIL